MPVSPKAARAPYEYIYIDIGVGEGPHGIFRPWARWMGGIDRDAVASVCRLSVCLSVCLSSVPPGATHPRPTRDTHEKRIFAPARELSLGQFEIRLNMHFY